MQNLLTALKDIPGVVGSFVLNRTGNLVAREMPAVYNDEMYHGIGRRLLSAHEAVESQIGPLSDCVLKFDSFWFICRRTPECLLGVLTSDTVNYPALKMATNVALKQVSERVAAMPAVEAPVIEPEPEPQPEPVSVVAPGAAIAAKPQKARRFWRGQPVD
jgi:predicted regulator of Ras-like GTPase activity (Roadblock/LC7/MglB family)